MTGLTVKKHDVVCQGCGGRSGAHVDVRCPFLELQIRRGLARR